MYKAQGLVYKAQSSLAHSCLTLKLALLLQYAPSTKKGLSVNLRAYAADQQVPIVTYRAIFFEV